ncbi:hypothetical protein [Luteolibacter sp. Populi]|uniref:hypothetical protein n=1 Tax=Luteolibacter sp. Populi TaxID=3230487 RepID=UPI00346599DA
MAPADAHSRQQARLWSASFGISALINVLVVLLLVFWISFRWVIAAILYEILAALGFDAAFLVAAPPPTPRPPAESVATIMPEVGPAREKLPPSTQPFARTSKDQESERPEKPAFTGDRNTTATSDAPAVVPVPDMPAQEGRAPRYEGEIETTVSQYQEGDLAHDQIAPKPAEPSPPAAPSQGSMAAEGSPPSAPPAQETAANGQGGEPTPPAETAANKAPAPASPPAPPKEALAAGPYQVDRQVKEETPPDPPKLPAPDRRSAAQSQESPANPAAKEQPKPAAPAKTPGFRGNQQKTQLSGSITRQGRSALDVEDSLLGRYHSSLSRAVEKEWQLACVRNRDYITPGQIIVRFVLEPSGKVRSLTFVEEFGVGNIQKGFTSESIRTAAIPPFPAELKKQLDGDPLEITYSFTF